MGLLRNFLRQGKAQALIEYLLLTIVVVFVVISLFVNPTAPPHNVINGILQDPIYMIYASRQQIKIN
ncbi:MAG: hypothetical protein HGA80_00960 [Candidatus Omnitrophica bacterium]|nr:hypothetical protein [Candidatus Omnitrophota bacterium]